MTTAGFGNKAPRGATAPLKNEDKKGDRKKDEAGTKEGKKGKAGKKEEKKGDGKKDEAGKKEDKAIGSYPIDCSRPETCDTPPCGLCCQPLLPTPASPMQLSLCAQHIYGAVGRFLQKTDIHGHDLPGGKLPGGHSATFGVALIAL